MVNFEINYKATYCVEWPKIKVIHNGREIMDVDFSDGGAVFTVSAGLKEEEDV